jgi:hypothetical protein
VFKIFLTFQKIKFIATSQIVFIVFFLNEQTCIKLSKLKHMGYCSFSKFPALTVQFCPTPTKSGWNSVKYLFPNTQQRTAGSDDIPTHVLEDSETSGLVRYVLAFAFLIPKSIARGEFWF